MYNFFSFIFVSWRLIYNISIYNFYSFIFGYTGSSLMHTGFLKASLSGGDSLVAVHGLSLWWLLLLGRTGSRVHGLSGTCGSQAPEHRLSN